MNKLKKIYAAVTGIAAAVMCSPAVYAVSPDTGNTEKSSYIWVIAVAGVLAVGAVAAGVLTKKKK